MDDETCAGHVDLKEYDAYYDHPTADHAIETIEMAANILDCVRLADTMVITNLQRTKDLMVDILSRLLCN